MRLSVFARSCQNVSKKAPKGPPTSTQNDDKSTQIGQESPRSDFGSRGAREAPNIFPGHRPKQNARTPGGSFWAPPGGGREIWGRPRGPKTHPEMRSKPPQAPGGVPGSILSRFWLNFGSNLDRFGDPFLTFCFNFLSILGTVSNLLCLRSVSEKLRTLIGATVEQSIDR